MRKQRTCFLLFLFRRLGSAECLERGGRIVRAGRDTLPSSGVRAVPYLLLWFDAELRLDRVETKLSRCAGSLCLRP